MVNKIMKNLRTSTGLIGLSVAVIALGMWYSNATLTLIGAIAGLVGGGLAIMGKSRL